MTNKMLPLYNWFIEQVKGKKITMSLCTQLKLPHAQEIIIFKNKGWRNYKIHKETKISKGKIRRCLYLSSDITIKPRYRNPWIGPHKYAKYSCRKYQVRHVCSKQERLRASVIKADKRGVKFLLTNSGTKDVMEFYNMFKIKIVPIVRTIAASKNNKGYFEAIATNY